MPEEPRAPRRRSRGGRRRGGRPQQAPAPPEPPPALRAPPRAPPARDVRAERRPTRRGASQPRSVRAADDIRPGTPCVILLDCREGEPDRAGQAATFEGFFDFETGELRRAGTGIPRLRGGGGRSWGC